MNVIYYQFEPIAAQGEVFVGKVEDKEDGKSTDVFYSL